MVYIIILKSSVSIAHATLITSTLAILKFLMSNVIGVKHRAMRLKRKPDSRFKQNFNRNDQKAEIERC